MARVEALGSMVSLGFGIGVVPQIVLDISPLAGQVQVLEVGPARWGCSPWRRSCAVH